MTQNRDTHALDTSDPWTPDDIRQTVGDRLGAAFTDFMRANGLATDEVEVVFLPRRTPADRAGIASLQSKLGFPAMLRWTTRGAVWLGRDGQ